MIGVGFVVAFVGALLVVRWLLRYVAHHDFVPFAWYRIVFGLSSSAPHTPESCAGIS